MIHSNSTRRVPIQSLASTRYAVAVFRTLPLLLFYHTRILRYSDRCGCCCEVSLLSGMQRLTIAVGPSLTTVFLSASEAGRAGWRPLSWDHAPSNENRLAPSNPCVRTRPRAEEDFSGEARSFTWQARKELLTLRVTEHYNLDSTLSRLYWW